MKTLFWVVVFVFLFGVSPAFADNYKVVKTSAVTYSSNYYGCNSGYDGYPGDSDECYKGSPAVTIYNPSTSSVSESVINSSGTGTPYVMSDGKKKSAFSGNGVFLDSIDIGSSFAYYYGSDYACYTNAPVPCDLSWWDDGTVTTVGDISATLISGSQPDEPIGGTPTNSCPSGDLICACIKAFQNSFEAIMGNLTTIISAMRGEMMTYINACRDTLAAYLSQIRDFVQMIFWFLRDQIYPLLKKIADGDNQPSAPYTAPPKYEPKNPQTCIMTVFANKFPLDIVVPPQGGGGSGSGGCPKFSFMGYESEACFILEIFKLLQIPAMLWLTIQIIVNL